MYLVSASSNVRRTRRFLASLAFIAGVLVATSTLAYDEEPGSKKQPDGSAKSAEPDNVLPGVSFSEPTLGESDSLDVHTWFPNDSGTDIPSVKLEIIGPDFLEWHDQNCGSGSPIAGSVLLGPLSRYTAVERRFCAKFKSGSDIKVGDVNILFVYRYEWKAGKVVKKSIVTVEKPLKIVLLGNDNIVGIPLGLAGLVVPGLFFWLGVGLWRAPWGVGLALGERLFYSVIVSSIFVAVGAWLSGIRWFADKRWLVTPDVLKGTSLSKLVHLAITGIVIGLILGAGDWVFRWWRRRHLQARTISPSDPLELLLEKLLNSHSDDRKPSTSVRLKDGTEYRGSLGAQAGDSTLLLAWFSVARGSFPAKSSQAAARYFAENRLLDLLALARSKHVKIELFDSIQDSRGSTGRDLMSWKNDQVTEIRIEPGQAQQEALSLK